MSLNGFYVKPYIKQDVITNYGLSKSFCAVDIDGNLGLDRDLSFHISRFRSRNASAFTRAFGSLFLYIFEVYPV